MRHPTHLLRSAICAAAAAVSLAAVACQTDTTEAVVVNAFPADATDPPTLYRVWYRTTLYVDPVAPGTESEALRVGAGAEHAYALLAKRYAPDAGPPSLVPARTREAIRVEPGETARIVFSESTALIGCDGPTGLTREEFDAIANRIFPGEDLASGTCAAWGADPADAGAP